eukprot:3050748-Prymnesium_polylepis.1
MRWPCSRLVRSTAPPKPRTSNCLPSLPPCFHFSRASPGRQRPRSGSIELAGHMKSLKRKTRSRKWPSSGDSSTRFSFSPERHLASSCGSVEKPRWAHTCQKTDRCPCVKHARRTGYARACAHARTHARSYGARTRAHSRRGAAAARLRHQPQLARPKLIRLLPREESVVFAHTRADRREIVEAHAARDDEPGLGELERLRLARKRVVVDAKRRHRPVDAPRIVVGEHRARVIRLLAQHC